MLVTHDADDLVPDGLVGGGSIVRDPLADGILAGQVLPGEGLVDDHDLGVVRALPRLEEATSDQRDVQRLALDPGTALQALLQLVPERQDLVLRSPDARLVYRLPGPTPDGRSVLVLSPLELLRRLARLVPPPRMHGVRVDVCDAFALAFYP